MGRRCFLWLGLWGESQEGVNCQPPSFSIKGRVLVVDVECVIELGEVIRDGGGSDG